MTMRSALLSFLFVLLGLFLAGPAQAGCSGPGGTAGDMIYNSAQKIMQYCDGTDWIAMNKAGSGSGGCSSPARPEGTVVYNTDHSVMAVCSGAQWMSMGPVGGSGTSNGPTSGLVGWWKLDEGATLTVTDSSGQSNTGALGMATPLITSADSTTDWTATNGTLATDADKQEGTSSLKLTATANDARANLDPGTSFRLHHYTKLRFWAKSGTGAAINDGQIYLFTGTSSSTNYFMWNFTYPQNWGEVVLDLTSPDLTNGSPTLSDIGVFRFDVNTSGNSGLIDYVRPTDPGQYSVSGKIGNAYPFNGNPAYFVQIPNNNASLRFTGNGSVSAWVKLDPGWTTGGTVFTKQSAGSSEWSMDLEISTGKQPFFSIVHTDGTPHQHSLTSSTVLNLDQWYHITGVWGSPDLNIYINGNLTDSLNVGTGTLRTGTTKPSSIGATKTDWALPTVAFKGLIDDVRVYNRALSQAEVEQLSSCSSPTGAEGSILYNSTHSVMQYCDGTNWIGIGK